MRRTSCTGCGLWVARQGTLDGAPSPQEPAARLLVTKAPSPTTAAMAARNRAILNTVLAPCAGAGGAITTMPARSTRTGLGKALKCEIGGASNE